MPTLQELIIYLQGPYTYPLFFTIMVLCSLGFPIQADLIILVCASLVALEVFDPVILILLGVAGIFIGDTISFTIGRRMGIRVLSLFPFNKLVSPKKAHRAYRFFKNYGGKTIFFARFLPGTRTISIVTSGIFKLSYPKFWFFNFLGISLMVPFLVAMGHFFVKGIQEAKEDAHLFMGAMFIVAFVLFLLVRLIVKKLENSKEGTI